MNEYYESVRRGLEEALEYAKGNLECRTFRAVSDPAPEYAPEDIRRIRAASGMTQRGFAQFLGVSAKAVEAWERGRNRPSGPARRLISVVEQSPEFPARYCPAAQKAASARET
jgi:putative transcriptional regulator